MPWPFWRSRPTASTTPPVPAAAPAPAEPVARWRPREWASLPAISTTIGAAPLTAPPEPFFESLHGGPRPPLALAPLAHDWSPDAPRGVVTAAARQPSSYAGSGDLTVAAPRGTVHSAVAAAAPRRGGVQRIVAAAAAPPVASASEEPGAQAAAPEAPPAGEQLPPVALRELAPVDASVPAAAPRRLTEVQPEDLPPLRGTGSAAASAATPDVPDTARESTAFESPAPAPGAWPRPGGRSESLEAGAHAAATPAAPRLTLGQSRRLGLGAPIRSGDSPRGADAPLQRASHPGAPLDAVPEPSARPAPSEAARATDEGVSHAPVQGTSSSATSAATPPPGDVRGPGAADTRAAMQHPTASGSTLDRPSTGPALNRPLKPLVPRAPEQPARPASRSSDAPASRAESPAGRAAPGLHAAESAQPALSPRPSVSPHDRSDAFGRDQPSESSDTGSAVTSSRPHGSHSSAVTPFTAGLAPMSLRMPTGQAGARASTGIPGQPAPTPVAQRAIAGPMPTRGGPRADLQAPLVARSASASSAASGSRPSAGPLTPLSRTLDSGDPAVGAGERASTGTPGGDISPSSHPAGRAGLPWAPRATDESARPARSPLAAQAIQRETRPVLDLVAPPRPVASRTAPQEVPVQALSAAETPEIHETPDLAVQRVGEASVDASAGEPGAASVVTDATPGADSAGDSPADMEELATKLYDRIRSRLRSELLFDRERAGMLVDL